MSAPIEQLSCQELVELVTEYLEGSLPADSRTLFEKHLGTCEGCRNYLEQMETTVRLVGELRPSDLTPEAEEALSRAFGTWKAQ